MTKPTACTLAAVAGELLKATREARGESVRDVAARGNVKAQTLYAVEQGTANSTLARLERIAGFYGVRLTFTPTLTSTSSEELEKGGAT